jgi:hypothetical protein
VERETYRSSSPHAATVVDAIGGAMLEPVRPRLGVAPATIAGDTAPADKPKTDAAQPGGALSLELEPEPDRDDADAMEHERQGRLRRWQAER